MKFQIFSLAIASNLLYFLMLSFAQDRIPGMQLEWSHTYDETVFTFRNVQRIRDSLKFEIEVQNRHRDQYKCFYVAPAQNSVHIDDNSGGDYPGVARVAIQNNSNNRLALNQIKRFTISIPAPRKEVSLINLHLGLYARNVGHTQDCDRLLINEGYNFHQLNWDVSSLK